MKRAAFSWSDVGLDVGGHSILFGPFSYRAFGAVADDLLNLCFEIVSNPKVRTAACEPGWTPSVFM